MGWLHKATKAGKTTKATTKDAASQAPSAGLGARKAPAARGAPTSPATLAAMQTKATGNAAAQAMMAGKARGSATQKMAPSAQTGRKGLSLGAVPPTQNTAAVQQDDDKGNPKGKAGYFHGKILASARAS